jgi:hypothetical protein
MRFFRSKEEKAQIAAAQQQYADLVQALESDDEGEVTGAARSFSEGQSVRNALSEKEREKLSGEAFRRYAETVLADDHLTVGEEKALNEVLAALDIPDDAFITTHLDVGKRLLIARANDGRIEPVADPKLMTKNDEVVYLETAASLMKEVVQREWRGGSAGFSFPIAKGIRFRTDQIRGQSVVVGTELQPEDDGVLSITSERVAYLGSRKTMEFQYSKLMNVEVFTDGIRFNATNRQRAPLFTVASGGEVVAATLNAAMHPVQ